MFFFSETVNVDCQFVYFFLSSFWPQTPLDHFCLYSNKQQKSLCEKNCIVYKVLGVFSVMAMVFGLHLSDYHKSLKVLFF